MFALTMTLVVLISAVILVHQWWTGALAAPEADEQTLRRDDNFSRPHHHSLDRAA